MRMRGSPYGNSGNPQLLQRSVPADERALPDPTWTMTGRWHLAEIAEMPGPSQELTSRRRADATHRLRVYHAQQSIREREDVELQETPALPSQ
jgi:hypothetical protein